VHTPFVRSSLEHTAEGTIDRSHSVLAVCGGQAESELFATMGFTAAMVTNIGTADGRAVEGLDDEHEDARTCRTPTDHSIWVRLV